MKKENESLLSQNSTLSNENKTLNLEIKTLGIHLTDVDSNLASLSKKYEIMATNVARFNKGKGKLDDILNDQIPKNNRKGLGFASTSGTKPTSSKEGAKK